MNFDDILYVVKDFANTATKKTEEVVGISKLKLEICKVKREIDGLYKKIGQSTYNSKKCDCKNLEYIDSLCDNIKEKLEYLHELERQIAQKKDRIICSQCNQENEKDNMYCKRCGSKMKD